MKKKNRGRKEWRKRMEKESDGGRGWRGKLLPKRKGWGESGGGRVGGGGGRRKEGESCGWLVGCPG